MSQWDEDVSKLERELRFFPVVNEHPRRLTEEQIRFYNENGYLTGLKALDEAGLRPAVKVMIGGAPVTDTYAGEIGAERLDGLPQHLADVGRHQVQPQVARGLDPDHLRPRSEVMNLHPGVESLQFEGELNALRDLLPTDRPANDRRHRGTRARFLEYCGVDRIIRHEAIDMGEVVRAPSDPARARPSPVDRPGARP